MHNTLEYLWDHRMKKSPGMVIGFVFQPGVRVVQKWQAPARTDLCTEYYNSDPSPRRSNWQTKNENENKNENKNNGVEIRGPPQRKRSARLAPLGLASAPYAAGGGALQTAGGWHPCAQCSLPGFLSHGA